MPILQNISENMVGWHHLNYFNCFAISHNMHKLFTFSGLFVFQFSHTTPPQLEYSLKLFPIILLTKGTGFFFSRILYLLFSS